MVVRLEGLRARGCAMCRRAVSPGQQSQDRRPIGLCRRLVPAAPGTLTALHCIHGTHTWQSAGIAACRAAGYRCGQGRRRRGCAAGASGGSGLSRCARQSEMLGHALLPTGRGVGGRRVSWQGRSGGAPVVLVANQPIALRQRCRHDRRLEQQRRASGSCAGRTGCAPWACARWRQASVPKPSTGPVPTLPGWAHETGWGEFRHAPLRDRDKPRKRAENRCSGVASTIGSRSLPDRAPVTAKRRAAAVSNPALRRIQRGSK
jgi:hypothetical protein